MGAAMRWSLVLFLIACTTSHGGSPTTLNCPPPDTSNASAEGTPCSSAQAGQLCFVENDFSSCDSTWYRCSAGKWTRDHGLGADDGQPCAGAPLQGCTTEGNPGCAQLPTSQICDCGMDGLWHCTCGCYGGQSTCPLECPGEFPGVGSNGPKCGAVGSTCTYPGHTCTCAADPSEPGYGVFDCQ